MIKAEVLRELGLEELIGTFFEEHMKVQRFKKGERIFIGLERDIYAEYIMKGHLHCIIYTAEGGEFYNDLYPGDLTGVNSTLANFDRERFDRFLEADVIVKEDSVVVQLPFENLLRVGFPGKDRVMEKILLMAVEETRRESKYLLYKAVCSDEEFFLKAMEMGKIYSSNTREISRLLNINLRTMQRIIKNLTDIGILGKVDGIIRIVDSDKLESYKLKFDK